MNCNEITERLDAWLDGELEEADAAVVERHVDECHGCGGLIAERRALSAMLHEALTAPAEIAAEEGRFEGLWDAIELRLDAPDTVPSTAPALQPTPSPGPSFWSRLATWWSDRLEQRQTWGPALAAAAVLVIMVTLFTGRVDNGGQAPAGGEVAEAPAIELPPFAGPRVAAHSEQDGTTRLAGGDTPAPRRRGSEDMVARANEATVMSYEVDRGIVLIEQPEEAEQPMIVWHLMPEDADGAHGDEDSI